MENHIKKTQSQIAKILVKEVTSYTEACAENNHEQAVYHLGRAHILSQYKWFHHFYIHFLMFEYALSRKDKKEVLAQVVRMISTIPGHMFKKLPKGNTGWSNVHLMEKMPLPKDFVHLFDD